MGNVLQFVAFDTRLSGFWRGLIDTRDVVFFLSVTALSLVVAFRALERRFVEALDLTPAVRLHASGLRSIPETTRPLRVASRAARSAQTRRALPPFP